MMKSLEEDDFVALVFRTLLKLLAIAFMAGIVITTALLVAVYSLFKYGII